MPKCLSVLWMYSVPIFLKVQIRHAPLKKKIGAPCIQSPERHVGVGGGGGKVHHFRFMTAMAMACTSLIAQKATMCVEALRFEWFSYCY